MKKITVVDLFCGAGGASEALMQAAKELGITVELLAINHWSTAIKTHTLNHPGVRHMCESVERVNPRAVVPSGRLSLLIAAPECTNHSRARGGRPINEQSRATAWHILKWAQELYIDNILIENVEEIQEWGPLGANSKPLKSRKGLTWRAFLEALRSLGYRLDVRVLNAADYGDPTTRRRLFVMARRGNRPIVWPMPTHSKDGGRTLFGKTERWRAAREIIDWNVPSRSIFNRKKPLSPNTMARILAGVERFGGEELKPFLLVLRQHMGARSLDKPLPTLVAGGQHMAVCEPFVLQQQSGGAPRSLEQPLPTIATDGAIALVEPKPFLVPHFGERKGQKPRTHSVDEPLPTIAATGHIDVAVPFIVGYHTERANEKARIHSLDEPLPTQTTENRYAVAEPFIASYYGTQNISPLTSPLPTVTAKDRFGLVLPVVNGRALDIHLRMLKPHELSQAMSFGADYRFAGTQGDQVKQIGNAWAVRLGKALIGSLIECYATKSAKPMRRTA